MEKNYEKAIAAGLNIHPWQVANTLKLFSEGATLQFLVLKIS
jgi:transcriptional accessory protein Tex/SPT6